ncbi:MAG: DUF2284 domain-containing protein [Desulfotomaculaceae bacterium]|nr:DUF2284 domain-containing protein [Desulfotomaculaceae bacterium]
MIVDAIKKEISIVQIKKDLSLYNQLASRLGATHVKILETQEVILDYRAHYKCLVPKCRYYNTNANCPPHAPSFESITKFIACFSFALLVGLKVSSTVVSTSGGKEKDKDRIASRRKLSQILNELEAEAFYGGYYFATAFSSGSCKGTWCVDIPCQALENGKSCRFPLQARPAMEAAGMDVFKMITNAGWPIYPIGGRCQPDSIPYGMLVGIVFII